MSLPFSIAAVVAMEGCLIEWHGKYLKKTCTDSQSEQIIALGRFVQNVIAACFIGSLIEGSYKQDWVLSLSRVGLFFTALIPLRASIEKDLGNRERAEKYEKNAYPVSLIVKVINVAMLLQLALERNSYEKPVLAGVIVVTYLSC